MEVVGSSLSKDAKRERCSFRPTMPAPSNGVVETAASAVSPKSSSQVPVKVGANSWDTKRNKASIGHRPNTFWPSQSPSAQFILPYPTTQNYPYMMPYASPICYYDPTLQPQIDPSYLAPPHSWNINTTSIYTQTLPFPSTTLPIPYVTHLRHMITEQIEYYFSDDNLAADLFLKLNMDDEGWVPITLIAGFNRVFELSEDTQFVRDSLIYSTTVEVQGEKVRRRDNWRKWLLNFPKKRKEDSAGLTRSMHQGNMIL